MGEIDTVHVDDDFMVRADPRDWAGARLTRHLLDRLNPGSDLARLNIHTLWSLLLSHPDLLTTAPALRTRVIEVAEDLVDRDDLGPLSRRELSDVGYAARSAQR